MNLNDPNIIDFSQFKKKKEEEVPILPLFKEPSIIVLGSPDDETSQVKYLTVANIIYERNQYLVVERMDVPEQEYLLAECVVDETGEFVGLQDIESDDVYNKVHEIFMGLIGNEVTKEEEEVHDDN